MKYPKPMTAAEYMARRNADPELVRQDAERQAQRAARSAQLAAEIAPEQNPLLAELAAVSLKINSVWDLVNTAKSYPEAIPILLKYLQIVQHPTLREGIARSLTVKEARGIAGPILIQELKRRGDEPRTEARWALANALTVVANDGLYDDIVSLIRDKRYGRERASLALALVNMKDASAIDLLIELLSDDEAAVSAMIALGKMKVRRARPLVEQFLKNPDPWVRNEAKKALAKIDKAK